jgi:hypothetical protein
MAQGQISLKRVGVDKANARIVLIAAAAAFLSTFFLIASYSLFGQVTYQNKVISEKKKAVKQLQANLTARDELVDKYKDFIATPQNLLDGNPTGTGPLDGSNAKLVLDSLPSKYDFPALASSVEKVMGEHKVALKDLTGNDDEVAQSAAEVNGKAQPVEVPFVVSAVGNYDGAKEAVGALYRSIRPVQIDKLQIAGDSAEMTMTVTAKTYYQPESAVNITKKVVK